mmetsp:Transcript_3057/g.5548  ORF Transcript_3057/g.5548 Transcript_3057/m.5548 type:complete len:753 (-) Transcript_3057:82-2340(-)
MCQLSEADASDDLLAGCKALSTCVAELNQQTHKAQPPEGVLEATEGLLRLIHDHCFRFVQFLISGLTAQGQGSDVQFNRLWILHMMSRKSQHAQRWLKSLDVLSVLLTAMAEHSQHEHLLEEGGWFLHELLGLHGVEAMTTHSSHAVQAQGAWVINKLAGRKREEEWPEANGLIELLLAMVRRALDAPPEAQAKVLWPCSCALSRLIYTRPDRGMFFMCQGGADVLVAALRRCSCEAAVQALGSSHGDLLVAVSRLLSSLAEGNGQAAYRLRELNALEVLTAGNIPQSAVEDVMWAVGKLGRLETVVEAIIRTMSSTGSAHGLEVLCDIVCQQADEDVNVLRQVAPKVLVLTQALCHPDCIMSPENVAMGIRSLGGIVNGLAPLFPPGSWQVINDSMELLVAAISPGRAVEVVQEASESLGRIANVAPAWREPLRRTALEVVTKQLRECECPTVPVAGRLKKYLFWAAAAIGGLGSVVREMRLQGRDVQVQDAAICAVIDMLNDSQEYGYALGNSQDLAEGSATESLQVSLEAMEVTIQAMRAHRDTSASLPVQYRGSTALGLLYGQRPPGTDVPADMMNAILDTVLEALCRHPYHLRVATGTCSCLRSLLECRPGADQHGPAAAVQGMRARHAGSSLRQVLEHFPYDATALRDENDAELVQLLEDAAFALALLDGPSVIVQIIMISDETETAAILQAKGTKALAELGRSFPKLFPAQVAQEVAAAATRLRSVANSEVQQNAELLLGVLMTL